MYVTLFIVRFLILLTHLQTVCYGFVQILQTMQPLYLLVGDQLSLTCTGPKNSKLLWLCATPDNNWSDQIIIANVSNRFVTRYTIEQPTGMEENQLIKSSVKNGDRGTYTCQDAQGMSSVAVWIVVIDLRTQVIPTPSSNAIVLQCNITGFDTNVPNIAYSWIFKNKTITGSRYSVTLLGGSLSLKISVPGSQDMGQYTCSFGLATTEGIATFQQLISVDDKFINIVSTNSGNFATFLRTLILCAISIIYIV